ncbi:MAG: class I SAM-dependent methyltransferase [Candidatus Brocadiales bacterium]|nr:class I SAM-dependent methyltransferase [Candidatus Bathyanammoxibius sp.]
MDVNVSNVSLKGTMKTAYLDQKDYIFMVCPICDRDDDSFLLADIRSRGVTSLESAFCNRCEHRYLRKLPSLEWVQRYYSMSWDKGDRFEAVSPSMSFRTLAKGLLKQFPIAKSAWRLVRRYLSGSTDNGRIMHLFPFLLGVAEGDGAYHLAQPDVNKVLEVGCGYGSLLEVFHKRRFRAFGTEASTYRAQICRKKGLSVFDCPVDSFSPIEHLGPFDLAYSTHVLEHIPDPAAHVENLSPMIREGGYLYIQVPHFMFEVNFLHQCHTPVHCHSFSPRSLSLLLERYGFAPIRMQIDFNIHILARKTPSTGSPFVYLQANRNTADPDQLLEFFENLSGEQGEPLRMTWDHAYVQIERVRDAQIIYKRKVPFNIISQPYHQSADISFRYDQDRPSFPVHFSHQDDEPPVWIKMS